MAIKITCPGCKSALTLADELRGKKVRCKKCETVVKVPDADAGKRKREVEEEKPQEAAANSSEDENEDEEDDRPKKKKKKKSKKGISPVLIIVPVLVLALLLVGGVSAFFLTRDNGPAKNVQAKVEPKKEEEEVQKPQIFPKIQDGSPTKKGGTGIVNNIRGAVYRTERKSELKNIALSFQQFCDEYKGANRTKENFLEFIKTFGPIRDAIKDGYYQVNMKARLEGGSIIAYERDMDSQGYLCAMGDGDVRYVPEPEWKQALGIK